MDLGGLKMNTSTIGKWVFLVGAIICVVAGVGLANHDALTIVLAVAGIVVGILNVTGAETRTFLIAGIALVVSASSLDQLPYVGQYITAIMDYLIVFMAPAVLIAALKGIWNTAGDA